MVLFIIERRMNQATINKNRRYLDTSYKIHLNSCSYHVGTTDSHSDALWKIFKYLRKEGYTVVTEAIFKTGGRADIFILDNKRSIEIMKTEKESSIEMKKNYYPGEIISVNARDVLECDNTKLYKLIN